jgi:cytidylate kinase
MEPESWTPARVLEAAAAVRLTPVEGSFEPCLGQENVNLAIRTPEVTQRVSPVAQMGEVREWVNAHVKRVAERHDVVVDGRDMGTAVFPRADLKVFLIADPWERARRRLIQRMVRTPTDDEIAAETERLVKRDAADATQTAQARDAVLIDTTYLTQAEQVERIVALARAVSQRPHGTSSVEKGEATS